MGIEELQRRIEELEKKRDGDVKTYLELEAEIECERHNEEVNLVMHLITYLRKRGSARV